MKVAYVLLGLLAFVVFVLALLPASVLTRPAEEALGACCGGSGRDAELHSVTGTVWRGASGLRVRGEDYGQLQWRFAPRALLAGAAGVSWRLRHADFRFQGEARYGLGGVSASATGSLGAAALRDLLAKYYIRLGGDFTFDRLALRMAPQDGDAAAAWRLVGSLRWSGGRTTYRLSGQSYDVEFPPLFADLRTAADGIRLLAFLNRAPNAAPLLEVHLDGEGWLHVAVARRFTRLAGKPWPGSGSEDEVVVTVSEQVLRTAKMAFLP